MSLDTVLARQAGVLSREQALAAGLTRAEIDQRLRLRQWRPLHPCVYLVAGHEPGDEARVRAALLWAGEGAVLCGTAAAWWHGMVERAPSTVGVTVDRPRRPRSRPGVAVRRRELAAADVTACRSVPVTAPPLTVLESAVELGALGGPLLDRALQQGRVHVPDVHAAHRRHGSASAGRLLAAAADRSVAVARRLLVRTLRDAGVGGWCAGHPVAGVVAGLAFPAAGVAIEVDGWAWHPDAVRTAAAARRRNALSRAGWTVLRYSWHDLAGRPDAVLTEIARAVAREVAVAR